MDKFK